MFANIESALRISHIKKAEAAVALKMHYQTFLAKLKGDRTEFTVREMKQLSSMTGKSLLYLSEEAE